MSEMNKYTYAKAEILFLKKKKAQITVMLLKNNFLR